MWTAYLEYVLCHKIASRIILCVYHEYFCIPWFYLKGIKCVMPTVILTGIATNLSLLLAGVIQNGKTSSYYDILWHWSVIKLMKNMFSYPPRYWVVMLHCSNYINKEFIVVRLTMSCCYCCACWHWALEHGTWSTVSFSRNQNWYVPC